ncbi:MAG: hypothetical protein U0V74_07950 [Chitinophagales bacterium]
MQKRITPELIPHERFHKGAWLQPIERPEWYYFKAGKNSNAITHKRFISSVDKPIRKLVAWLHKRGIKTTPSCSGHHVSERNFEMVYTGLKKDMEAIKNGGLQLKDIETGKVFTYQNPNYKLPWTKSYFMRRAVVYQQRGVLGMHLGKHKQLRKELKKLQVPGAEVKEREGITFIYVKGDAGNNSDIWREVTRKVMKVLKPLKKVEH